MLMKRIKNNEMLTQAVDAESKVLAEQCEQKVKRGKAAIFLIELAQFLHLFDQKRNVLDDHIKIFTRMLAISRDNAKIRENFQKDILLKKRHVKYSLACAGNMYCAL